MDIHTAAKYINLGYRVRRPHWRTGMFIDRDELVFTKLVLEELLVEDWEIITEGIISYFPIVYDKD